MRYLKGPVSISSATPSRRPELLSSAGNLARPRLLRRLNNVVDEAELQPLVFPLWLRSPGLRRELESHLEMAPWGDLKHWWLVVGLGRGWVPHPSCPLSANRDGLSDGGAEHRTNPGALVQLPGGVRLGAVSNQGSSAPSLRHGNAEERGYCLDSSGSLESTRRSAASSLCGCDGRAGAGVPASSVPPLAVPRDRVGCLAEEPDCLPCLLCLLKYSRLRQC